jgi:hypothetical protein
MQIARRGHIMDSLPAAPGDVLAVWTGQGLVQDFIRAGEALTGKPAVANHVVIITHQDQLGRWMGIQGQPGGVGLVDCTPYLSDVRTMSNHAEPRPDDHGQLVAFLSSAARSLGIGYDWVGIAEDTLDALHASDLSALIDPLWRWPADRNLLPGHVVCSSLAAMLYDLPSVGWAHPDLGAERRCEPADWWQWSQARGWLFVSKSLRDRVFRARLTALCPHRGEERGNRHGFPLDIRGRGTQDEVRCKCRSRS